MLSHVLIALMIQLGTRKVLRTSWWSGAVAASCWAVSREITQAEYRWIERFGGGLRANMPWWGGLNPAVWHADALLDWLLPTLTSFGLAWYLEARRRSLRAPAN